MLYTVRVWRFVFCLDITFICKNVEDCVTIRSTSTDHTATNHICILNFGKLCSPGNLLSWQTLLVCYLHGISPGAKRCQLGFVDHMRPPFRSCSRHAVCMRAIAHRILWKAIVKTTRPARVDTLTRWPYWVREIVQPALCCVLFCLRAHRNAFDGVSSNDVVRTYVDCER